MLTCKPRFTNIFRDQEKWKFHKWMNPSLWVVSCHILGEVNRSMVKVRNIIDNKNIATLSWNNLFPWTLVKTYCNTVRGLYSYIDSVPELWPSMYISYVIYFIQVMIDRGEWENVHVPITNSGSSGLHGFSGPLL